MKIVALCMDCGREYECTLIRGYTANEANPKLEPHTTYVCELWDCPHCRPTNRAGRWARAWKRVREGFRMAGLVWWYQ